MVVEFRVLGEVEARVQGRVVDIGHARQRGVLAALLVDANRTVPVDVLLDRVWADQLPQRARNALSGYISRLRRLLSATGDVAIARQPGGGYRLSADPMAIDLHRFHHLIELARTAAGEDEAVALFEQAFGLWRGDPFGSLQTPWLDRLRVSLDAQRLAAELDRNDLALRRGGHAVLADELAARSVAHPSDERLAGQLVLALYRCGRQSEALHHYERLRHRLAQELGADPSPPLQQLHHQILTGDLKDDMAKKPVPRQLPAPPRLFTGRAAELAALDSRLSVSALSGTAGVGKTALALHWAHRVAETFPDGQLFVNLRGFDPSGSVMAAADAVRVFLDALGVPAPHIPAGLDAQIGLYRSLLAGKRMLIVLDNARDAEHVRPLLPGTPGCVVVVTSRDELTGLLAADGAQPVTLDLLTPAEAHDMLAHRLGPQRVTAEPDAVTEIVDRCARLPLALTIMAARAANRPRFPLAALADELRDTGNALDALRDVRAVFSWSYRARSVIRPRACSGCWACIPAPISARPPRPVSRGCPPCGCVRGCAS